MKDNLNNFRFHEIKSFKINLKKFKIKKKIILCNFLFQDIDKAR
jgi:hypothetical protein